MFNTLEMAGITRNGFGQHNPLADRYEASAAFESALRRGKARALRQKLLGRAGGLRHLPRVDATTARRPAHEAAVVNVPLSQIVGSEGRASDFDSQFNPLNYHTRDRWINIAAAARRGVALPPVELIQAADGYYVRDGHHRISVARALGQGSIEGRIVYVLG
jgi:hypothetical protein